MDEFLASLPLEDIARRLASASCLSFDELSKKLAIYVNESRSTLSLVHPYLDQNKTILEVGAGICLFSLFLKSEGYHIVALEPAMGGFAIFEMMRKEVLQSCHQLQLPVIESPAQGLNPARHGFFDLIFSNNVIEHIPTWSDALSAMLSVLSPSGVMVHSCPNYAVPYEPHYGVPVLRCFPHLSRKLFLPRESDPAIWNSLNFISYGDIRKFCKNKHIPCTFRKGTLYYSLKRLCEDPWFRKRHRGWVFVMAEGLIRRGWCEWTRYIPPAFSTPMVFEINLKEAR